MSRMGFCLLSCTALLLVAAAGAKAADPSSSALIARALDKQVPALAVQGGLLDVMKEIETQTGVRVEATQAVYDALPWGEDTTITVNVKNTTLRQTLDSIAKHLGLAVTLGQEAVELEPTNALHRLGRRATLEEVQVLDLMASTPADVPTMNPSVGQLLELVDKKLEDLKSPFAIENRAFDAKSQAQVVNVPRSATLMDATEELTRQTDATWYPWGHSVVVVKKIDATRLLLSKRLTRRFREVELQQVLMELSEYSNVCFTYEPAALRQVPEKYQRVTLTLDSATVQQTLDSISGGTGLKFTTEPEGVRVSYAGATTQPLRKGGSETRPLPAAE